MTVTVNGGEKFKKFIELFKKQKGKVDVGFFPKATYKDGTPVATVAIYNEFGTERGKVKTSSRPFMRPTFVENKSKWLEYLRQDIKKQDLNVNVVNSLSKVGRIAQKDVQTKIDWWAESGIPRNAELTIKIKSGENYGNKEEDGRDVGDSPLIWSGHMRESVDFEVSQK